MPEFVYFIRAVFVGMGNESEERVRLAGGDGLHGDEEENNAEEGRMQQTTTQATDEVHATASTVPRSASNPSVLFHLLISLSSCFPQPSCTPVFRRPHSLLALLIIHRA